MIIVLDPAHGKDTPGKRSPDGKFREYKWSREICDALKKKLTNEGIECLKTVNEDYEVGLRERVLRTNKIKGDKILISIHCNAAGMGNLWMKARGFSIWTSRGNTKSDSIAEKIWENFEKEFPELPIRSDISDGDKDYEANFTVLMCNCPAVLIETLFMDNKEDLEVLESEDFKIRFVDCLFKAIKEIV